MIDISGITSICSKIDTTVITIKEGITDNTPCAFFFYYSIIEADSITLKSCKRVIINCNIMRIIDINTTISDFFKSISSNINVIMVFTTIC